MTTKRISHIVLVIVQLGFLLTLTGCWDSVELNRRAIVSGVAIDRGPTDDKKYIISFQVIVAEEISGKNARGTSPVALFTGSGRTMFEALANTSRQTARFLSLGHIRVLVISEKFAREGIKDITDVLERNGEMRLTSLVFISRGQPASYSMSTMTVFSKIPANDLVEKLETTSKQFGYNYKMEIDDVIRGIQVRGGGPLINGVYVSGPREKGDSIDNLKTIAPQDLLKISGISAFKDDKLKGWLDGDAAIGASLLQNKIKELPILIKLKEGSYVAFNVYQSQVHVKAEAADPEHPVFTVKISQQATLKESFNPLDLTNPEVLNQLSVLLSKETRLKIESAISSARKLKSDFLGFGEAMERENPRGWKKVRDHWEDIFTSCKINVESDAVIRHTDMRTDSLQINKSE